MKATIGILALGLLGLAVVTGGGSSGTSATNTTKTAAEAAQVGDVVTVEYPASTIMCAERSDMEKVYLVGELQRRQTMRIEDDAWKAIKAERAGQKYAMSKAYSCEWAPNEKVRFMVQQKKVNDGNERAGDYVVASYCLKPMTSDKDECWWIAATATSRSPIVVVERAKSKVQRRDAEQ